MGQINTNNYPTVNSLADTDLLIVENATHGTGTTTPKQLRENAIGTTPLQTTAQSVTGAINELKTAIDSGAGVACYDVDDITDGYLGEFDGSSKIMLLHLTTSGVADADNGYTMMLEYTRPVARYLYGQLVDSEGVAYKQDVYAENTIICEVTNNGVGTESDPRQVVILGITNAAFTLTPTAVVSDRDIIDGQGNTLSVLAEALTKTASGNPIVITDCAGGKARSLKTTIEAIQDLHGLPFPYVGGAYKNKLPFNEVTATVSGVTFTHAADGTLILDGTATADIDYFITGNGGLLIPLGTIADGYILNGCVGGSDSTYELIAGSLSSRYATCHNGDVALSNVLQDGIRCIMRVHVGTACNHVVIKPMIRPSTESDATFAPYSNICPISGRTEVRVDTENEDGTESAYAVIQLGQTVYGAEVNFDTGVVTVKTKIEDMGNLTYNYNAENNVFGTALISDMADADASRVQVISSVLKGLPAKDLPGIAAANDNSIAFNAASGTKFMRIKCTTFTDGTAIRTAFTGQKICYELATPTTLQLTPAQLELLKGYNRVSIDNGSIELGYIAKLT